MALFLDHAKAITQVKYKTGKIKRSFTTFTVLS